MSDHSVQQLLAELFFVELLSSDWLMEEEVNVKHISNMVHQVKSITINNARAFY